MASKSKGFETYWVKCKNASKKGDNQIKVEW